MNFDDSANQSFNFVDEYDDEDHRPVTKNKSNKKKHSGSISRLELRMDELEHDFEADLNNVMSAYKRASSSSREKVDTANSKSNSKSHSDEHDDRPASSSTTSSAQHLHANLQASSPPSSPSKRANNSSSFHNNLSSNQHQLVQHPHPQAGGLYEFELTDELKSQSASAVSANTSEEEEDSLFWASEDETLANLSDSFTISNLPDPATLPLHNRTSSEQEQQNQSKQQQQQGSIPKPLLAMEDDSNSLTDHEAFDLQDPSAAASGYNDDSADSFANEQQPKKQRKLKPGAPKPKLPTDNRPVVMPNPRKSDSGSNSTKDSDNNDDGDDDDASDEDASDKFKDEDRPSQEDPLLVVDKTPLEQYDEITAAEQQDSATVKERRNRHLMVGAAVCCCCLIVLAIILVLLFATDLILKDDNDTARSGPTPAPTPYVLELPDYSQAAIEANPNSPQALAYRWLRNDPSFVDYTDARLLQRFALATFYYSTRGDDWTASANANWLDYALPECEWTALESAACVDSSSSSTADSTTATSRTEESNIFAQSGKVRKRELQQPDLQVPTADEFSIQHINLPDKNLRGELPPELALLTALQSINIANCSLVGSLPSQIFSSWTSLTSFTAMNNFLTGSLSADIGLWTGMTNLDLSLNQFESNIPTSVGSLTELEVLNLANNEFSGSIGSWISTLTKVETLRLHHNNLSGDLPPTLGDLTLLERLELDHNQFQGPIPSELGLLTALKELWLGDNSLNSKIPPLLGNLVNLETLALVSNALTGNIPSSLRELTSLKQLWLYDNKLTGTVPRSLETLAENSLQHFIFYFNEGIIGIIPDGLCGLDELQFDCAENLEERTLCGCEDTCTCIGTALEEEYLGEDGATGTEATPGPTVIGAMTAPPSTAPATEAPTIEMTVDGSTEIDTFEPSEDVLMTDIPEEEFSTFAPTDEETGMNFTTMVPTLDNVTAIDSNFTVAPSEGGDDIDVDEEEANEGEVTRPTQPPAEGEGPGPGEAGVERPPRRVR